MITIWTVTLWAELNDRLDQRYRGRHRILTR